MLDFYFVLSVFYESFNRIDGHSVLYDCIDERYSNLGRISVYSFIVYSVLLNNDK
jgi:hypothetical protein